MSSEGILSLISKNKTVQYIVVVVAVVIGVLLVVTFTDIDEQLTTNWQNLAPSIVVIVLIIMIAFFFLKPSLSSQPDPMDVLATACKTTWFMIKGYNIESIKKDLLFVESGRDCYFYYLRRPNTNIVEYVKIVHFPKIVVTDHIDFALSNIDKRKKLGAELSTEDIESAIEKKKLEEQVRDE